MLNRLKEALSTLLGKIIFWVLIFWLVVLCFVMGGWILIPVLAIIALLVLMVLGIPIVIIGVPLCLFGWLVFTVLKGIFHLF